MLTKLFEALDEKVFTAEMKESMEVQFNEAVEAKAQTLAEELASEKISEVIDSMTERVELLEAKQEDAIAEVKATLEEEFAEKETAIVESIDKYLDKAIAEFIAEAQAELAESVKSEKAELVIDALSAMMVAAGVEVSKIVEAKEESEIETKLAESIAKYDALVEETIAKDKEIDDLIKIGVIGELKEGLTLVESEKFEKLAGLVEFSKDASYAEALQTIKESIKTSEAKEEILDEAVVEKTKLSSIDPRFV
jgi:hypothetical protein